ncbi:hypothetical protein AHMF7605_02030 [Adhaeribacter arboris]|uniref:Uncharacterized protein n=1 Tax=Adhaeribacter arboris TaxID=2072846 RepID=A0A2T2YAB9_9BACT|nr:hypothetical protein AHMF7605_02030 [Adhaeribacter arboris]
MLNGQSVNKNLTLVRPPIFPYSFNIHLFKFLIKLFLLIAQKIKAKRRFLACATVCANFVLNRIEGHLKFFKRKKLHFAFGKIHFII